MPRKRGMDVRHRQGYFLGPKRAKARGLGGMRFWLTSISDVHFARCSCCIQSAIVHHVAQVRDGPIAVCISALIGAHRLYFALHHGRHRRPHKKWGFVARTRRPFLDLKPAEPLQGLPDRPSKSWIHIFPSSFLLLRVHEPLSLITGELGGSLHGATHEIAYA